MLKMLLEQSTVLERYLGVTSASEHFEAPRSHDFINHEGDMNGATLKIQWGFFFSPSSHTKTKQTGSV